MYVVVTFYGEGSPITVQGSVRAKTVGMFFNLLPDGIKEPFHTIECGTDHWYYCKGYWQKA